MPHTNSVARCKLPPWDPDHLKPPPRLNLHGGGGDWFEFHDVGRRAWELLRELQRHFDGDPATLSRGCTGFQERVDAVCGLWPRMNRGTIRFEMCVDELARLIAKLVDMGGPSQQLHHILHQLLTLAEPD